MQNKKVKVTIRRGNQQSETFTGEIIGETTSHWLITNENNKNEGELFAKQSLTVFVKAA